MSNALTIGQMAAATGVSTHTLRYYEQAGLIRAVARTEAGHRLYSGADRDWLLFLMRLKATGMPIAGMQAFAELRARGNATVGERREMLAAHRDAVLAQIEQLQTNLAAIDEKIVHYATLEADMTGKHENPSQPAKDTPWKTRTHTLKPTATHGDGTS